MENKYLSRRRKENLNKEKQEESLILKAKYAPNERIIYKGHIFTLKYAYVKNNILGYLGIQEKTKNPYFLSESVLAQ